MWEKFVGGIKDFVIATELTRRNSDDIRELRRRMDDLSLLVERLAYEIRRVRENEAHEREKIILRLEPKHLSAKPRSRRKK